MPSIAIIDAGSGRTAGPMRDTMPVPGRDKGAILTRARVAASGAAMLLVALAIARPALAVDTTENLTVRGTSRSFIVHVPPSYNGSTPVPLLFMFHGLTGTALDASSSYYNWKAMSDAENFIVIFPESLDGFPLVWPSDPNSDKYWDINMGSSDSQDLDFVSDMITWAKANYNISAPHIFTTGHSYGAYFSYYVAVHLSDDIAAFGEHSGGLMDVGGGLFWPTPVPTGNPKVKGILIHSTDDSVVAYSSTQTLYDALVANGHTVDPIVTLPAGMDHNWDNTKNQQQWDFFMAQAASTHTVTFVEGANGSRTGGGALVQVVNDGDAAVAPTITPDTGFTFDGWDVAFDNVTVDLTVTAQYTAVPTYTVTFVEGANGARTGGGALVQVVNDGAAATAPVITPDAGFTFDGWDVAFDNVTGDLTVTAQYTQITYTVTFVEGANGSRTGGGALVQVVNYGAAATAPVITPDAGYSFDGWSTVFDNVTSDLTVTAQYSLIPTCPYITAGPTATLEAILIGDDSTLAVTATDPNGDPLTYTWIVLSGPGDAVFSPNGTAASDTSTATPDSLGVYTFQVTVSDGTESAVGVVDLLVLVPADDSDLDGLTNAEEIAGGTDPDNADTDGDGMPDGWEVTNGLDPLGNDASGDPDGDEITNLEEFRNGLDPNVVDVIGLLGGGIGCAGGGAAAAGSLALVVLAAFGLAALGMRARSAFAKTGAFDE